jgi:DNA processing protein
MSSPRFPSLLLELSDPPPLLFLQGQTDLLYRPAVAIVGSRKATETGRRVAETVARTLAEAGVVVVSGMARGIDGAAHRGALSGGGETLGVLGSGIGVIYPSCNRSLFRDVADGGLLVSEFLPGEGARAHHFPKRNRIIAALARAVVVVEAGERSGALITVDHALDLGREILAVPGSLENPQARSSNLLLRDGARPLIRPESILEEIEHLFPDGFSRAEGAEGGASLSSGVPSELRALWETLQAEPRGIGELAREAGVAPEDALSGLSVLELGGWAVQCPGMRFQRR